MNLAEVIKELNDKGISHAYSAEYQKRGLPHAHTIITLDQSINNEQIIEYQKRGLPHAHILITFDQSISNDQIA
jgi:hypothetical protein